MKIAITHPRFLSLTTREKIVAGVKLGITSLGGLTSHGRGEAFDYLLNEKTHPFARESITASGALLLLAKHPVISVNGNSAALNGKELIKLSKLLDAPLEINIFHAGKKREVLMKNYLKSLGAKNVLMPQKKYTINHISSNRKFVNKDGIYKADVVFVPLEDGDRAQALIKNGKKVITIDLNPRSRTSQKATITIVDNIIRAMPLLIEEIKSLKTIYSSSKARSFKKNSSHSVRTIKKQTLEKIIASYDNKKNLKKALKEIKQNL